MFPFYSAVLLLTDDYILGLVCYSSSDDEDNGKQDHIAAENSLPSHAAPSTNAAEATSGVSTISNKVQVSKEHIASSSCVLSNDTTEPHEITIKTMSDFHTFVKKYQLDEV